MTARQHEKSTLQLLPAKPARGMTLAFTPAASADLAHIPARVIDVWPRFRSGDYLVTLEYDQPVKLQHQLIRRIDAFVSELYQPAHCLTAHVSQKARTQAA